MGQNAGREDENEEKGTAGESYTRIRAAHGEPLRVAIETIRRETHAKEHESVRSLWRTGDAVVALHAHAEPKEWRKLLGACSAAVGVHPSYLDDAALAARAFPPATREPLLGRFDESGTPLTRSHVIELVRVTHRHRARGIEALVRAPMSTTELRAALRRATEVGRLDRNDVAGRDEIDEGVKRDHE